MSHLFQPAPIDTRKAAKIIDLVCKHYGLTPDQLKGNGKKHPLAEARAITYWLLYMYSGANYSAVAAYLGRTHGSAVRGTHQVQFAVDTKTWVFDVVEVLEAKIKSWLAHPWHGQNKVLPDYTMKAMLEQKVNKHLTAA